METNKINSLNNPEVEDIIYFNNYGIIFKENILISNNIRNIMINISCIRKVIFRKERNFRWNIFIILVYILFLSIFFCFQKKNAQKQDILIITFFSIIVTITFFLIKEINYKLIFLLDTDKIIQKVRTEDKSQAKNLMIKINKMIK